jgi:ceruloplasmin
VLKKSFFHTLLLHVFYFEVCIHFFVIFFTAINGRTFGTLKGLDMCLGDRVSWHMYGLGQRFDHHHFSFEGNNFLHENRKLDTTSVLPGTGQTVSMITDQAGMII